MMNLQTNSQHPC